MRNPLRSFLDLVDFNLLNRARQLAGLPRQFFIGPPIEFDDRAERPHGAGKPMSALGTLSGLKLDIAPRLVSARSRRQASCLVVRMGTDVPRIKECPVGPHPPPLFDFSNRKPRYDGASY